jgi:nitrogen fixation NifU-like protein
MSEIDELYQEVLLEHSKNRRYKYKPVGACACALGFNPLCGDEVSFFTQFQDGVVTCASYEGQGCAISQASASMAAQQALGSEVGDAKRQLRLALAWIISGKEPAPRQEDWLALGGVSKFPMRVKCATMPLRAALASLELGLNETVEIKDAP